MTNDREWMSCIESEVTAVVKKRMTDFEFEFMDSSRNHNSGL